MGTTTATATRGWISFVIPRGQGFEERVRPTEGSGGLGNPNLALCLRLKTKTVTARVINLEI